ncbi:MAG TPA: NAD(P)-dependent oxidoreductase [Syntrophobacteria bacterium]|nr:NAD(P)-dependent oxidoreductase [Syntrophobacteria bacterium]
MKRPVGFMGLGAMGAPMAANILRAEYPLTVFNRSSAKTAPLADLGARVAPGPRELAQASEVIVAMVTDAAALDALLWGPGGAAAAMDQTKVFINMSTVSPRYTRELSARLAPSGVTFIDAPVSGSRRPAEEGTLIIFAGGKRERVTELTPLLETMGKKVIYCGEAGQGSMMKMAINLLLGIMMEAFAEAISFGVKGGLAEETVVEAVFAGPLSCGLYRLKSAMVRQKDFPAHFPLKHMCKDLKSVIDTAYETGAPIPAGQNMLQLYRLGVGHDWGELDFAAIYKVLEHLGG